MAIRIQPSRKVSGIAEIQEFTPDSAATFVRGDPVRIQADGEIEIHPLGATVVDIAGFVLCDCASGVSDDPSGKVPVAKADRVTVFLGQMTESGAVKTDLTEALIGDTFGLLIVSGETFVDFDDTTNVVVEIIDIDTDIDVVFFKVIESALQLP